jgi:N-acetylglucosaminyltransferase
VTMNRQGWLTRNANQIGGDAQDFESLQGGPAAAVAPAKGALVEGAPAEGALAEGAAVEVAPAEGAPAHGIKAGPPVRAA